MSPNVRYAIYWLPKQDSLLWQLGSHWLGYDSYRQTNIDRQPIAGVDFASMKIMTQRPARYGFHATLKAPFYLNHAYVESDLIKSVENLCSQQKAVQSSGLLLADMGAYIGLSMGDSNSALSLVELANVLVEKLDKFRQPMTIQDRDNRIAKGLDARGIELLDSWGYPAVKERFHCHLTLVDSNINNNERVKKSSMMQVLQDYFNAVLGEQMLVDEIALMKQVDGRAFTVLKTIPLES